MNILINPEGIKGKPWQVDLSSLLNIFLSLIIKCERLDLRLCGTVALSSALIYRLKVETLFLFEKLKSERRRSSLDEPPVLIVLPFRFELTSTDIEELLLALKLAIEEALAEAKPAKQRRIVEAEPSIDIDRFLLNIRELLEPFRARLMAILRDREEILFTEFVAGMTAIEEARSFILLLFLAMDGIVALEQLGDDIRISRRLSDGGRAEG